MLSLNHVHLYYYIIVFHSVLRSSQSCLYIIPFHSQLAKSFEYTGRLPPLHSSCTKMNKGKARVRFKNDVEVFKALQLKANLLHQALWPAWRKKLCLIDPEQSIKGKPDLIFLFDQLSTRIHYTVGMQPCLLMRKSICKQGKNKFLIRKPPRNRKQLHEYSKNVLVVQGKYFFNHSAIANCQINRWQVDVRSLRIMTPV